MIRFFYLIDCLTLKKMNKDRCMGTFIHIIVIYVAFKNIQMADCSFSCPLSTPTINYVISCPHNQTEWEKASKRKNCEIMAPHQNCTESKNFQYHCLINHLRNATLEVCAPLYYLQGYCAYYNTNNKEIMENYDQGFECLKFPAAEQCPSRYPSSDAFKYQRCYAKKNPQPTTTLILGSASPTNEAEFRSVVAYIVFIAILAVALVAVSSLFIWWERKTIIGFCTRVCKPKNSQSINKDEEGNESKSLMIEDTNMGRANKLEEKPVDSLQKKDINIEFEMANKDKENPIVKPKRPPPPLKKQTNRFPSFTKSTWQQSLPERSDLKKKSVIRITN